MRDEWNGLIMPDGMITAQEEARLAAIGIHRAAIDWKAIFKSMRADHSLIGGEPYDAPPRIVHTCECFVFASLLYKKARIRIGQNVMAESRCGMAIDIESIDTGDLVYIHDARLQHFMGTIIDHVGIVTDIGSIVHSNDCARRWEGTMSDFVRHGRFVIGRRVIGANGIVTFALGDNATERFGFSPDNVSFLRTYL
ncbi:C40 family peptidase [Candidatus Uhrbacteria bacterium]|nr:C40 family peptidase [Candidatus Uhrbacteria bacterium]